MIYKKNAQNRVLSQLMFSKPVELKDFHCHCDSTLCHFTLISDSLPDKIALIKERSPSNLIMTSAYRCQSHNKKVGGVDKSFHTIGEAVDLYPEDSNVDDLYKLMSLYFDVVIKYATFVHGHNK